MKSLHILLVLMIIGASSSLSHAEIYKWKDKNGAIRYSDTPPPSNTKQEAIGGKKPPATPANKEPLAPVKNDQKTSPVMNDSLPGPMSAAEAAAAERQRNAEAEKNNKQEKEAEAKRKAENCKAAKANFETYTQGGRIYKMNEKGEREYVSDAGLEEGKAKAQQEINENCN